jgi:beta-lactamase regulating signal transducer with metallopeptidase domain
MIAWAVSTAIAVSALILLVLLIRGPVARLFGARAAYALWAAPLLRAILPPLPVSATPEPVKALGSASYELIVTRGTAAAAWSWTNALLIAWGTGAALFLAVQLFRHHRFITRALRDGRALIIEGVDYDVVASSSVHGPVATGLVHPLIFVPLNFAETFSPEQQRLALLHEQLHHRRGDIWASAAALIVTAFLWFNPFAYLGLGAFRRDMEAACDARVLADTGADAAPLYAETILRCAATPVPRSLCALTAIDELKGRLMMLKNLHGDARRTVGLILAGSISVAGLALAFPAAAHEEPGKDQVFEKKVIIRTQGDKDVLVKRDGGADLADIEKMGPKCSGEKVEIAADGGTADNKRAVKFFLCGKEGGSRADLVNGLEKAVGRLEKENDMDPAIKADLVAKLKAKIAELRARG